MRTRGHKAARSDGQTFLQTAQSRRFMGGTPHSAKDDHIKTSIKKNSTGVIALRATSVQAAITDSTMVTDTPAVIFFSGLHLPFPLDRTYYLAGEDGKYGQFLTGCSAAQSN